MVAQAGCSDVELLENMGDIIRYRIYALIRRDEWFDPAIILGSNVNITSASTFLWLSVLQHTSG
jgi:hypothetical protein